MVFANITTASIVKSQYGNRYSFNSPLALLTGPYAEFQLCYTQSHSTVSVAHAVQLERCPQYSKHIVQN